MEKKINYPLFVKADGDAFFGLLADTLAKVLIVIGTMLHVFNMPAWVVYGKVLPGIGIGTAFGAFFYAYQAKKLAMKEGRTDVTAQPYGLSSTHVFVWLFSIIAPVYFMTNDGLLAWRVGLAAGLVSGILCIFGSLYGNWIQKVTPKAALLGTLAGVAITFVGLNAYVEMFANPYITFIPVLLVLLGFFAQEKMPFKMPAGLLAVFVGTIIAWTLGYKDMLSVQQSIVNINFYMPIPVFGDIIIGLKNIVPFLPIVIPLSIQLVLNSIQAGVSAHAAGDKFDINETLVADGAGTVLGAIFGNPFPLTVYVGHPTWKAIGAGRGYMILEGAFYLVAGLFGIMGLVDGIIPYQAAMAFLIFIGLTMSKQAFGANDNKYVPAIIMAILPQVVSWLNGIIGKVAKAAGTKIQDIGTDALIKAGVHIDGINAIAQGAIITSIMWGSITAFIIDRNYYKASMFAALCSVFSFFGLIHGKELMMNAAPTFTISYLGLSAILFALHVKNKNLAKNTNGKIEAA
jgi:AGZA family xanthine/uracil permease-like MFS transporter